jgi:hypothetical protein
MTMPSMDMLTYGALMALALAVLYSLGLFDRLLGRSTPAPAPAPQPIAPPAQPMFYAGDPTPAPPADPYSLLLDYHAQVTRAADVLAAQRVYYNAVNGRSVGREADMITTFVPPTPAAIPLPAPAPPPTIEAPTAAATVKARATTTRKAAK